MEGGDGGCETCPARSIDEALEDELAWYASVVDDADPALNPVVIRAGR